MNSVMDLHRFNARWRQSFLEVYLKLNRKGWWKESQIGEIELYKMVIREKAEEFLNDILIKIDGNIYRPIINNWDELSVVELRGTEKDDRYLLVFNENSNRKPKPKSKRGLDELTFLDVYGHVHLTLPLVEKDRDYALLEYQNSTLNFSFDDILYFASQCYSEGVLLCPSEICYYKGMLRFIYPQSGFKAKNRNGKEHLLKELTDFLIEKYSIDISPKRFRKEVREMAKGL